MFGFFENKVAELYKHIAPEQTEEEKFLTGIAEGNFHVVREYVEVKGYNVNQRNANGNTPLHVAAFNGQMDIVNYFLEKGADPVAKGQRSNTCLHYAAVKGHLELTKRFIQLGISPLEKNDMGKTPYDVAEGFGVKQYLMPLMFSEEHQTGTAPKIMGASVDPSQERERLRNLAPPPKMGEMMGAPAPVQQQPVPGAMPSTVPGRQTPPMQAGITPPMSATPPPGSRGESDQSAQMPPLAPQAPQQYQMTGNTAIQPSSQGQFAQQRPSSSPAAPNVMSQQQQGTPPRQFTPPPQTVHSAYVDPNRRPNSAGRTIQPDGFVTTVGNPELAAKYGNKSNYRAVESSASSGSIQSAPPPTLATGRNASPFSKARYVTYDATSNTPGMPVQYSTPAPGAAPAAASGTPQNSFGGANVNVFTPSPVQVFNPSSQQQPQQQQQPAPQQQFRPSSPAVGQQQQGGVPMQQQQQQQPPVARTPTPVQAGAQQFGGIPAINSPRPTSSQQQPFVQHPPQQQQAPPSYQAQASTEESEEGSFN